MKRLIQKAKARIEQTVVSKISPRYKINYRNQGQINFIDVGSVGDLPEPWRQNANYLKFVLNFEPNDAPVAYENVYTYNTALWETEATLPFFIYKGFNQTGSSLFKQNHEFVSENFETLRKQGPEHLADTWFARSELVDTIELYCRPLDKIVQEEFPKKSFHFLKVDAQGAEFNILKGAQSLLKSSCVGLHLELFTIPLYQGIVLLDEVAAYLSTMNFEIVKKFPAHGTFNSQHDCLFLKRDGDAQLLQLINKVYGLA